MAKLDLTQIGKRLNDLWNQGSNTLNASIQNFNQPRQVTSPNFKPLFQTPLANAKPINYGQIASNVGNFYRQNVVPQLKQVAQQPLQTPGLNLIKTPSPTIKQTVNAVLPNFGQSTLGNILKGNFNQVPQAFRSDMARANETFSLKTPESINNALLGSIGAGGTTFAKSQLNLVRSGFSKGVRNLVGQFTTLAETNPNGINRKQLGLLGEYIHSLADTVFGKKAANLTNKQLANAFDAIQQEAFKLKPSGLSIGLSAKNIREGQKATGGVNPLAQEAEIQRVANNLIKNNQGLQRKEAEAMAKDVIAGRKFNQATGGKQTGTTLKPQTVLPQNIDEGIVDLVGQKPITTVSQPKVITNKPLQINSSRESIPSSEEIAKSIPAKIDQFMQDTLEYSTKTPTGGGREASGYTKTLRSGQAKLTTAIEGALSSKNAAIRTAASTLQNVFRGLGMSPERSTASFALRGEMSNANQRAFDVMDTLYKSIGNNKGSLQRINAVLDPSISKTKISFNQLSLDEKAVYTLIRQGLDLTHDISYANGHISKNVYKANLGKYTPRMYDVYEMPTEVNNFVNQGKKMVTDLYKSKKTLDDWKIDNSLNDPVYALGKRLSQVQTNTAIKKYTDYLASNPKFISDVERPGFVKLSDSPAYGSLSSKYVLNSAAEDLKGFFFSNQGVQNLYDAFRAYDRMGIRQLQKKLLTVFNPTTNVGNIVSDQVFGFVTEVNPYTLNKNILVFKKNPSQFKQLADYLMSKGIVGTDITRTDFVNKLSSIDSLAQNVGKTKNILIKAKNVANKVQSFYGGTDDVYKTSAFKALLDKGYSLEEATRKVADGFQNYASVGKFYDVWAKTPIVGSAFIKFQGDLIRIIKNGAVNNPLGLISFLGTLYGAARLFSKASGEKDQDRITRENRFAAPMIPGLNIPLTWQTPMGEINVARYISPFYANNETTSIAKMFPFIPNISTDKSGNIDAAKTIAQSSNDPLLGTPVQLLVNRDFRGKPISDPNENKYQPSTLTQGEKLINQAKFVVGNYMPPTINSLIDVKSAAEGNPNRYGSMQTVPQSIARVGGIKISQYGAKEAEEQRQKDAYYDQLDYQNNNSLIKAVAKDQLTGKIDQKTANARIAQLQTGSTTTTTNNKNIMQLPDGTYGSVINKMLRTFDSEEEAQLAIDKYEFKKSGKNIQTIDDNVFRLSKSGIITTIPKIDYETNLNTQRMENAVKAEDYKTWLELAEKQYQNYQTQLQDTTLDELEKVELQQKIDSLIVTANKYKGYGGIKKPKKLSISIKKLSTPKVTIRKSKKLSIKAPKLSKLKTIRIKQSIPSRSFTISP